MDENEYFDIPEFEPVYNRHYMAVDGEGRVTDAWSNGPFPTRDTEGYICFNERGQYQLRLIVDGVETEENPALWTMDGIPLYKWDGEAVHRRTEEEIEADRAKIPPTAPSPLEQLRADVDFMMVMADLM